MGPRSRHVALLALALFAPTAAAAGDAPRALRTLAYGVDVRIAVLTESTADPGSVRKLARASNGRLVQIDVPARGSGEVGARGNLAAKGTIVVDVVQATDDEGLVVDVAEDASERTRAKVRVVVGPDGAVAYDPSNARNVTEEEIALVRWLARGFYAGRPTDPGTEWTVDQSGNGHTDLERYRVTSRDGPRVILDYGLDEKASGTNGYEATRRGSLTYDPAMVLPVKASFRDEARRVSGGTVARTAIDITLTLVSDSFARRRP